ncbi:MAG: hypothetical protein RL711_1271 [Bacteroidota bacterium]
MSAPIISPKFFSLGILLLLTTSILEAQENDDMYYSRKDRLKAVEQQQATPKDSPTYWTPNVAPYNYDDQGTTQVDTALMNKYAAQARQDNQEKIATGNTYITNNYNNQNYNQQYSNQTSSRRRRRWGSNWNNNYNYGAGWNVSPYIGFGYNNYLVLDRGMASMQGMAMVLRFGITVGEVIFAITTLTTLLFTILTPIILGILLIMGDFILMGIR